ncbi:hypothetical protein ABZ686_24705 [Streptomyces sp. NPDC006992]|uniref:hypothetical protein n=1 Tax=unclassified Streptomyces TaxID=2593676 RepID=UPI0033C1D383
MPQRIHTTRSEVALSSLTEEEFNAIKEWDDGRLRLEKSRVAPQVAARMTIPANSIFHMMREWEIMVVSMEADWNMEARPLLDDYLHALESRAALEKALDELHPLQGETLTQTLDSLDQDFLECTEEAGKTGAGALEKWLDPLPKRPPEWLWKRCPRVCPW